MFLHIIKVYILQVAFVLIFMPGMVQMCKKNPTCTFSKSQWKFLINLCFIMEGEKMLFSQSSHTVTFTHLACSWRSFSWACLSKLASCPCVEHAHQTSSTLPVWHMHARHVQWHPHNKLATERINFPVHYSTDVCFNFFLMERLWFSINRQKKQTRLK